MPADTGHDLAACRRLMRGGSKSFFAASLLLPARVRAPASALYAFCRVADDEIDLGTDPHDAADALRRRLDAVYAGAPADIPCDRALRTVVRAHAIPRELLDALLEGFVWDADGRRYEQLDDVEAYGARVAGTVGAMMALIMGVRSRQALARACELGVAMQLTNIARDVGEDARNGRLYLPRRWLADAGVDADAWLRAPRFDGAIGAVVASLLAAADRLYARAEHGIAALPRDCRPAIRAARLVYAEIGHRLRRDGLDSIARRTVVSSRRKLALMARAGAAAWSAPGDPATELAPLPAIAHLVDAAAQALPAAPARPGRPPSRSLDERVVWVLDLFERQAAQRALR
jgi:phytoene synthase